jgi:hypothetical protein
MYEMEGALSGLAAPGRPVARLPRRRAPPARARHPCEAPVSRPLPRPGVAPGRCPFPTVKVFLLPMGMSRKGLRQFILSFFYIHTMSTESLQLSALDDGYPPVNAQCVHRLPGVSQVIPNPDVALCNRLIFH